MKCRTAHKDRGRILFVFVSTVVCFHVFGRRKLKHLSWSSMIDDAITWSSIGVLGSPVYIYGSSGEPRAVSIVTLNLFSFLPHVFKAHIKSNPRPSYMLKLNSYWKYKKL